MLQFTIGPMKYPLFLLALIVHFFNSSAQDTSYYNSNWKPCSQSIATYARISNVSNSGYKVKDYYYPSMALQMTGTYEDKKLEYKTGDFFYYTREGKLSQYAYFEMDELNDWNVLFNKEGKPVDSSFYVRGSIEKRRFYHNNNYLWFEENYKNSLLNDTTFTFFPNGKIKRVEIYKNNSIQTGYCLDSLGNKTPYVALFQKSNFPGGENRFYEWISANMHYPSDKRNSGIEGEVSMRFSIDTSGKPFDITVQKYSDSVFSKEAVTLLGKMPNWTPFLIDGEKTNSTYNIPIKFQLKDSDNGYNYYGEENELLNLNDEPVYSFASEMPEFTGGTEQMYSFIKENIQYPEIALENGVEAKIPVSIVIRKNGEITRIKVLKQAGWGLDEEAVRIIKSMPPWKPGKTDGIPVNVKFIIQIKFNINEAR